MTDQTPEPLPEEGEQAAPAMNVTMEGSITDGVFRIDAGVQDIALITIHFNNTGAEVLDQLLAIVSEKWPVVHESIIEAYEAAQSEEAPVVEEAKHRAVLTEDIPAEEEEVVQTLAGEGVE